MQRCLCVLLALLLLAPIAHTAPPLTPASFFLRDGDTVVVYGDSITEQQMYARDLETFMLTRYPRLHVKFINSGWSGDRVTGGGGGPIDLRLKRDVVNYKPTVVTVFLGMNDGGYASYDDARFQTYAQGLTHIVDALTQALPGVRLTLLTPSFFDYAAKERAPLPAGKSNNFVYPAADYNDTLIKYGDFVKKLGAERSIPVADTNAPMAAATAEGRKTDPNFSLFGRAPQRGDGVHPNEAGHVIIAAAVLQAWHAQPTVADLTLPVGKTITATTSLPWPVPDAARDAFRLSPLAAGLNVFIVYTPMVATTANLPMQFRLIVDSTAVDTQQGGNVSGVGFDLNALPALPQNQQAAQVLALVQQRISEWHDFWKGKSGLVSKTDVPTDDELAQLRAEDAKLDARRAQAHEAAQPKPHTFKITPAALPAAAPAANPALLRANAPTPTRP